MKTTITALLASAATVAYACAIVKPETRLAVRRILTGGSVIWKANICGVIIGREHQPPLFVYGSHFDLSGHDDGVAVTLKP